MQQEILYSPAYTLAKINLNQGDVIYVEAGAMVSMSDGIAIETKAKGGLLKSLGRAVLGGESFFINTYTAEKNGEITLAPTLPGDILPIQLSNQTIYVQSGSYLASTNGIEVDTQWGGAKTFFSSEGLFLLKIAGNGIVWLSSYGAIHKVVLAQGQIYKVDTGHIVSFESTVQYSVRRVGGWKSTILSGEGLVCELTGPGNITLQTRSEQSLLSWLIPKLPKSQG
jgi:uncharacterized protein (TIGR00266 family)